MIRIAVDVAEIIGHLTLVSHHSAKQWLRRPGFHLAKTAAPAQDRRGCSLTQTDDTGLLVGCAPLLRHSPEARQDQITHRQQLFRQAVIELNEQLFVEQNFLLPL